MAGGTRADLQRIECVSRKTAGAVERDCRWLEAEWSCGPLEHIHKERPEALRRLAVFAIERRR